MSNTPTLREVAQEVAGHWEFGDAVARRMHGELTPENVEAAVISAGRPAIAKTFASHFAPPKAESAPKPHAEKAKPKSRKKAKS